MDDILRFSGTVKRDSAIDAWFRERPAELGSIAQKWFARMRQCGADVRELMHDGCPVACVADVPFAYVNVFRSHVNVGFFNRAALADPAGLLEGDRSAKRDGGLSIRCLPAERLILMADETSWANHIGVCCVHHTPMRLH
jgi:hypothetical protein